MPPRYISDFIYVRAVLEDILTFEIRADRRILVAIFGAGFL